MNHKEKALTKLNVELDKDIDLAVNMSKACGFLELLCFFYILNLTRIIQNPQDKPNDVLNVYTNAIGDSIKYIIALISKFGKIEILKPDCEDEPVLNMKLYQALLKHVNYINSKYESKTLIQLFDVQVSGERDQFIKIDMQRSKTDPEIKKIFDYFLRIDNDNDIKKNSKMTQEKLLENFKIEYQPSSDLFLEVFGVTIDDYCSVIENLLGLVREKIKSNLDDFDTFSNGNINLSNYKTFINYSLCFLEEKESLLEKFESKFHPLLEDLTFNSANFNEKQLRFHQITRQPLIEHEDIVFISPVLILDSLFLNTHYSLLETVDNINERYKARQSNLFLAKLSVIAKKFGFNEVEREKDLFEGKKQIGDIDIIFKNDTGEYLLIEAKNHALPLDIYFKDVIETKKHLTILKEEWEKKVLRRFEHLKSNHTTYDIPENYSYIIVSLFPEIISHYSDLLYLSIQEFEIWLENYKSVNSFNEFYNKHYESKEPKFTKDDIKEMQKANLLFGKYKKK